MSPPHPPHPVHTSRVTLAVICPSGRYAATASPTSPTLLLHPLTTPTAPPLPLHGHTAAVLSAAFSPSSFLLTASRDTTVRLWQPGSSLCARVFPHTEAVTAVCWAPSFLGPLFIAAAADASIRMWNAADGAERAAAYVDGGNLVTAAAFIPHPEDSPIPAIFARIALGTYDGSLQIYDITFPRSLSLSASTASIASSSDSFPPAPATHSQTLHLAATIPTSPPGKQPRRRRSLQPSGTAAKVSSITSSTYEILAARDDGAVLAVSSASLRPVAHTFPPVPAAAPPEQHHLPRAALAPEGHVVLAGAGGGSHGRGGVVGGGLRAYAAAPRAYAAAPPRGAAAPAVLHQGTVLAAVEPRPEGPAVSAVAVAPASFEEEAAALDESVLLLLGFADGGVRLAELELPGGGVGSERKPREDALARKASKVRPRGKARVAEPKQPGRGRWRRAQTAVSLPEV